MASEFVQQKLNKNKYWNYLKTNVDAEIIIVVVDLELLTLMPSNPNKLKMILPRDLKWTQTILPRDLKRTQMILFRDLKQTQRSSLGSESNSNDPLLGS